MDTDILDVYARSFRDNHDLPALTDYGESGTLSYLQLAERIAQIHIFFEKAGIRPGDKVALIGEKLGAVGHDIHGFHNVWGGNSAHIA